MTYYLNVPIDVVRALGISENDEFVLSVENKDGDVMLCYKRVKKG